VFPQPDDVIGAHPTLVFEAKDLFRDEGGTRLTESQACLGWWDGKPAVIAEQEILEHPISFMESPSP
jgi:hypothetical protein